MRRTHAQWRRRQVQPLWQGIDLLQKRRAGTQGDKARKKIHIGRRPQPVLEFVGKDLQRTELEKRGYRIIRDIRDHAVFRVQQQGIRGEDHHPVNNRVEDRQ